MLEAAFFDNEEDQTKTALAKDTKDLNELEKFTKSQ